MFFDPARSCQTSLVPSRCPAQRLRPDLNSRAESKMVAIGTETTAVEEIVSHIHSLYTNEPLGLLSMAKTMGIAIEAPRPKVTVMLVGNHSAGKSSFINWYIGEYVQLESAAMETNSFTFVSFGKKRDTFRGRATIKHKPWLAPIETFPGAIDNLTTQICSSRSNMFAMCDFIDTPGLTDGSLKYPYPVNDILEWLGIKSDLILVFFDPHGQALCSRTMNVVNRLNQTCKPKTHYFLTLADQIPTEKERSKVILQVAQSLSHAQARPILSTPDPEAGRDAETCLGEHALRVRPIFIPGKAVDRPDLDFNRIDEVQQMIADAVNQNVQNHIERLESDSRALHAPIADQLKRFESRQKINRYIDAIRAVLLLLAWLIPVTICLLLFYQHHDRIMPVDMQQQRWVTTTIGLCAVLNDSVSALMDEIVGNDRWRFAAQIGVTFLVCILTAAVFNRLRLTNLSAAEARQLYSWRAQLDLILKDEVPQQWKRFFAESVYE